MGIRRGSTPTVCAAHLPTLYRYDHIDLSLGRSYPVRTNRITDRTEILFREGWKEAKAENNQPPSPYRSPWARGDQSLALERELTLDELKTLHVQARLESFPPGGWDHLRATVYNGSSLNLKEITLALTVWKSSNEKLVENRLYRVRNEAGIGSLQTGNFDAAIGFEMTLNQRWSHRIAAAKGTND